MKGVLMQTQWTKEKALSMLCSIAQSASEASIEMDEDRCTFKNQAAMVALRAIDLANKMCGFASPEEEGEEDLNLEELLG